MDTDTLDDGRDRLRERALGPPVEYSTHAKQREVLRSRARYRVCKWGRRAGKNILAAIDVIERARRPWASPWGSDDPRDTMIWWIAPSYDQAREHGFETVKALSRDRWIADGGIKRTEPYEIEYIHGVRVQFRTFDHPETLQGAGIDHHVIDEADLMSGTVWNSDLDPMLIDTRGSALFISKPYRPRSYFQRFFEYGRSSTHPDFESFHATSADNPFIAEDPEDKRGTVPDHVFRREYLAELPEDGGAVFSDLDTRLFTEDPEAYGLVGELVDGVGEVYRPLDRCTPPFSIGVDFARSQDYRVTAALDASGAIAYYSRGRNESWDGIESDILDVHDRYEGIVVPDSSRDNKIVADIESAGVPVIPTSFSPKRKKELIENLTLLVENDGLTAPDDPRLDQLRLELRTLEKDVTPSGYTRYHAPDPDQSVGDGGEVGFDDSVDALALSASQLDRISAYARRREALDDVDDEDETRGYDLL